MPKPHAPQADPPVAENPGGKVGQILTAARHIFLEQGYGNTSMDAVAKRAGVSKATLYVHFDSKERLFGEVVAEARAGLHKAIADITQVEQIDPVETLCAIGEQFLSFVTTQGVLTLFRAVIGETQRFPELGQAIYLSGSKNMLAMIADCIADFARRGLLAVENPSRAANQFIALTKSDLHLHCLLEPDFEVTVEAIRENVRAAVAVFMSHYGIKTT